MEISTLSPSSRARPAGPGQVVKAGGNDERDGGQGHQGGLRARGGGIEALAS